MNNISKLLSILFFIGWFGCTSHSESEKYQNRRNNIVNVREEIKEIEMEDVLIGQVARLYIMNDYLIIQDSRSLDKLIHIFNKNDFTHIVDVGERGQGPGEIPI